MKDVIDRLREARHAGDERRVNIALLERFMMLQRLPLCLTFIEKAFFAFRMKGARIRPTCQHKVSFAKCSRTRVSPCTHTPVLLSSICEPR